MHRDDGWQIIDEQRSRAAGLLESLDPAAWDQPSWCAGWSVKDVAAHLSLAGRSTMREILSAAVRMRFRFDPMIDLATRERAAARDHATIIAELRGLIGSRRLAPGTFWRDPLLDIVVHQYDIARPLGLTIETPAVVAREVAEWTWSRGAPFQPAKHLSGRRLVATDIDWQRGDGKEVRAPIVDLMLLSTGRKP